MDARQRRHDRFSALPRHGELEELHCSCGASGKTCVGHERVTVLSTPDIPSGELDKIDTRTSEPCFRLMDLAPLGSPRQQAFRLDTDSAGVRSVEPKGERVNGGRAAVRNSHTDDAPNSHTEAERHPETPLRVLDGQRAVRELVTVEPPQRPPWRREANCWPLPFPANDELVVNDELVAHIRRLISDAPTGW